MTYIYQDILQYLRPSKEEGLVSFDIPANLSREERGLENHVTAQFLIPRQHLDVFEKDPNRSIMPLSHMELTDHCFSGFSPLFS